MLLWFLHLSHFSLRLLASVQPSEMRDQKNGKSLTSARVPVSNKTQRELIRRDPLAQCGHTGPGEEPDGLLGGRACNFFLKERYGALHLYFVGSQCHVMLETVLSLRCGCEAFYYSFPIWGSGRRLKHGSLFKHSCDSFEHVST